jgi:hypothetical protein
MVLLCFRYLDIDIGIAAMEKINLTVVVSCILTLLTAGAGIWRFSIQQQQANRTPFLQKQLELSFLVSETASRLATETDSVEWEKARVMFWRLYWGPLSIVEDGRVETAMVSFGKLVPEEPVKDPKLPMTTLQIPSYELAHVMRDLVLESWNVHLTPLRGQRQP